MHMPPFRSSPPSCFAVVLLPRRGVADGEHSDDGTLRRHNAATPVGVSAREPFVCPNPGAMPRRRRYAVASLTR